MSTPQRQRSIYLEGARGTRPLLPTTFPQLEQAARQRLSPEAFAYIAGGAGVESTQRDNCEAFSQWKIRPRMLRDVSQRDLSVTILGRRWAQPFFLCPIGVLELAHPHGDVAVAQACRDSGVAMVFSNQASYSMERCAAELGDGPRWFQLYWSKSNELVASLVQRAEGCGCEAIVVTLDTPLLGWRGRDLDLAHLPFLKGAGLAQYFSDPVFLRQLDDPGRASPPEKPVINLHTLRILASACRAFPGSFWENLRSRKPLDAVRHFLDIYSRTDLTWPDLEFLRSKTRLPIVLKGIVTADDARQALEVGVDAIMVSNHGGRQVDGAVASLDALPEVVEAVAGQIPVLFDSGIRCAADIYKALALGASAVGLGRPYVYALALAGRAGVSELLENFRAELELQMALSGRKEIPELRDGSIRR